MVQLGCNGKTFLNYKKYNHEPHAEKHWRYILQAIVLKLKRYGIKSFKSYQFSGDIRVDKNVACLISLQSRH
jgi:hypothetical protein